MDDPFFDDADPATVPPPPSDYVIPPGDDDFGVSDDFGADIPVGGPSSVGGGSVGGGGPPNGSSSSGANAYTTLDDVVDDGGEPLDDDATSGPSALDVFLAKWELTLDEKRKVENEKKAVAVQSAREELARFAEEREFQREKKQSKNRTEEQVKLEQLEADLESENPWERVVNLVDLQFDTKVDLGRMKQIFIQLKNENPLDNVKASNNND